MARFVTAAGLATDMAAPLAAAQAAQTLVGAVTILSGSADPTSGGGVAATAPAMYLRTGTEEIYIKTGAEDTAWDRLALASELT